MRNIALAMAGVIFLGAMLLLPILILASSQYPLVQGLVCVAIGAVLLACIFTIAIGITRKYEWNIFLLPCIAVPGLVSLIGLDVPLMMLTFLLFLTTIASGLAMKAEWRTAST